MPLLDGRSRDIVLRIVYDGAPEAGKTTNLQRLCEKISLQRRGPLQSPGTSGARTMFFDWLDVTGGYVAGRRVRCQLLTVPGQPSRLRRRSYLLRSADAVVLVCDSRPEHVEDNRRQLAQLDDVLRRLSANAPPVGLVLQANKQDLVSALSAEELRDALQLAAGVPTISAEAHAGVGVMEAFTLGVRLAVDRVRALVATGGLDGLGVTTETPDELLGEVAALDEREPPDGLARIAAATAALDVPPLPRPDLPAGQIWPPVHGRAALAAIAGGATVSATPQPWAPRGALELRVGGWTLHTRGDWVFPDVDAGRAALLALARRHVRLGPFLPEGRSIALGEDAGGWRLWMFTPALVTLADALARAISTGEPARAAAVVLQAVRALHAIRSRADSVALDVDVGLAQVAISRTTAAYAGEIRDGDSMAAVHELRASIAHSLDQLLSTAGARRAAIAARLVPMLPDRELSAWERDVLRELAR